MKSALWVIDGIDGDIHGKDIGVNLLEEEDVVHRRKKAEFREVHDRSEMREICFLLYAKKRKIDGHKYPCTFKVNVRF